MMCEKCWADAFDGGWGDQVDNYRRLLVERTDKPCTPRDQAGQWWDEKRRIDTRTESGGSVPSCQSDVPVTSHAIDVPESIIAF